MDIEQDEQGTYTFTYDEGLETQAMELFLDNYNTVRDVVKQCPVCCKALERIYAGRGNYLQAQHWQNMLKEIA